ncbi:MAG: hypothetical protein M1828_003296 [Chrysothrix sp. TS-e1954]|nr:MAG: hypothetical protein M1828_003296 [Chrysothrix sp. TS-e1954]
MPTPKDSPEILIRISTHLSGTSWSPHIGLCSVDLLAAFDPSFGLRPGLLESAVVFFVDKASMRECGVVCEKAVDFVKEMEEGRKEEGKEMAKPGKGKGEWLVYGCVPADCVVKVMKFVEYRGLCKEQGIKEDGSFRHKASPQEILQRSFSESPIARYMGFADISDIDATTHQQYKPCANEATTTKESKTAQSSLSKRATSYHQETAPAPAPAPEPDPNPAPEPEPPHPPSKQASKEIYDRFEDLMQRLPVLSLDTKLDSKTATPFKTNDGRLEAPFGKVAPRMNRSACIRGLFWLGCVERLVLERGLRALATTLWGRGGGGGGG